ncbi:preprotein translocase subunit SecG [Ramlibacter terrae]|uniref:Protein-export membrane protein SecG n=1 Tax=Ramlibacter terrae TaxID=2732511 RepID=A0ABX6P4E4_9BURK|nr:preprotein translocase subunit SecG [Ramlibacter terrae]
MNVLLTIVLAVQMLTAPGMIGLILVQHGKGADMGAAFGSGSSGSLFGASGSANFLSRTTGILAAVFFACTLLLAYFGNARPAGSGSVLERAGIPAPAASAPAVPVGPAGQIPGGATSVPAPQGPATSPGTGAPAVPASGAGAIPTK